jgi:hypothetical protein
MLKSMPGRPIDRSPGLPEWVKPRLCKLVDAPPRGPEWLHEIKYGGYRLHARPRPGAGPTADADGPRLDAQIPAHSRGRIHSAGALRAFAPTGRPLSTHSRRLFGPKGRALYHSGRSPAPQLGREVDGWREPRHYRNAIHGGFVLHVRPNCTSSALVKCLRRSTD